MNNDIIFNAKPDAVPYTYRLSYKISLICLIIHLCCPRGGCSIEKLQMISSAVINENDFKSLIAFIDNNNVLDTIIHFDPTITRGIKYALGDKLLGQQNNGYYKLSSHGKNFAKSIATKNIMLKEKHYLNIISSNLTQAKINYLVSQWRFYDVENKSVKS